MDSTTSTEEILVGAESVGQHYVRTLALQVHTSDVPKVRIGNLSRDMVCLSI
jgi:hypothetical protein